MSDSQNSNGPHIVYIGGATHSGSTLVDLILGSHPMLQSLGEIKVLCRARHQKRERVLAERCTCGASDKLSCPFWRGVESRLQHQTGGGLRELDLDHPDPATFVAHNRALFDAVVSSGGTAWLIDSSKSPRRLGRLLAAGVFDVRPIHLIRSPYGVTYSHIQKGRSALRGVWRYATTRHKIERILRHEAHLALRYESFVASPAQETARVMHWLGLSFEAGQLDWTAQPHHNLCGNRMRFSRTPEIRLDEAWREGLSTLQKATIAALSGAASIVRAPVRQSSSTSR